MMNLLSKMTQCLNIDEIKEPIVFKPFANGRTLDNMVKLYEKNKNEQLKKDIALIKKGLKGERLVYFELKNCNIPMIILHDVRLEFNGYIAQYDFCVITHKNIYVLEVKNLLGDLYLKSSGEFIRKINGKVQGMFSPISQNKRHLTTLEKLFEKNNLELDFKLNSLIVLTNEKAVITFDENVEDNKRQQICRLDQLIDIIEKNEQKSFFRHPERCMKKIGNLMLINDVPAYVNIEFKYKKLNPKKKTKKISVKKPNNVSTKLEEKMDINSDMILIKELDQLKIYRRDMAKLENKKPYMIFNNTELAELVKLRPKTKEELLSIKGFGTVKIEKYAEGIITIFNGKEEKTTDEIVSLLKDYRHNKSKEKKILAYKIFTNEQLELLSSIRPISKADLSKIKGFGKVKLDKYGDDIINILNM